MRNGSGYRRIPILSAYLLAIAMGVTQCFAESQTVFLLLPYFLAASIADWIRLDGRFRSRPIPHIVQSISWFLWMPSLIAYMVWTRKLRGLGWLLLHGIGFTVVMFGSFYATMILFYSSLVGCNFESCIDRKML